jgi:outer membrane protein TolC
LTLIALLPVMSGCTGFQEYFENGFKVGPNYGPPQTDVAKHWIEADDPRVKSDPPDLSHWWTLFDDPVLNDLVRDFYKNNLALKEANMRVQEAQSQLAIAKGNFFPQTQDATASYQRIGVPVSGATPATGRFFDQWTWGMGLAWQVDIWGQYRRAIAAAEANLCAAVEAYDATLVGIATGQTTAGPALTSGQVNIRAAGGLADVAATYVDLRTAQQRIKIAQANAKLQRVIWEITKEYCNTGVLLKGLDDAQLETTLSQLEATIPPLEAAVRGDENHLCQLMGIPPCDLHKRLGEAPIPRVAPEVVVGVPAELLRRRPDVRLAQFKAAAQAEQIGIAQAQFYPMLTINGNFDYQGTKFADLFKSSAFGGSFGPSFQWNILNYGRILNNVRLQDQTFRELLLDYCDTVLLAHEKVEGAIALFLAYQRQEKVLATGEEPAKEAVVTIAKQFAVGFRRPGAAAGVGGVSDIINRTVIVEQALAAQQDQLAVARGNVAEQLLNVYVNLGGGWEMRLAPPVPEGQAGALPPGVIKPAEPIHTPEPPAFPGAAVAPPEKKAAPEDAEAVPVPPANPKVAPKAQP